MMSKGVSPGEKERSGPNHEDEEVLREIRRDYLACKYPSQIRGLKTKSTTSGSGFPENSDTSRDDFPSFLESNPLGVYKVSVGQLKNQPPIQYRISFVKYVIKQLETRGGDEEAVSIWYEALETFGGGCHEQTEPFYRIYDLSRDESCIVKIFESEGSFVVEGTTGLITWEASLELSKWLKSCSSSLSPKWVAELGCGCGFLAVANLKMFPNDLEQYLATDGSPSAVEKCRQNVLANLTTPVDSKKCKTMLIDWERDEGEWKSEVESLDGQFGPGGVLLGADIVFDPTLIPPLVRMIDVFLRASRASKAFLASTHRNDHTFRSLKTQLESTGKSFQVVHSWANGEILDIKLKD